MTIAFQCSKCQRALRVPDDVAGKRLKCPQCQEILRIPAAAPDGQPETSSPAEPLWQLKTGDQNIYGPVPKDDMDQWLAEGRITGECQLAEGDGPWQPAGKVYPQLALPDAAPPPPPDAPAAPSPALPQSPPSTPVFPGSTVPGSAPFAPLPPDPGSFHQNAWSEKAQPSFRSRTYPVMQLTSRFYRALGWMLIFAAAVAAFLAVITIGGVAASGEMAGPALALYLGISLLILIAAAVSVGAAVITLWFAAEAIQCLIDIQENTQRTAFHQQHAPRERVDQPA